MTLSGRIAQILAPCAAGGSHRTRAPQGVALPYVVFTFASSDVANVLDGPPVANNTRLQVDVYSATAAEADTVMDAVTAVMQAAADAGDPRNYAISSPADQPDPDTRLYRVMIEFSVWS